MVKQGPSRFRTYNSYFAIAVAAATALGVGGCGAGVTSGGSGGADGGDDSPQPEIRKQGNQLRWICHNLRLC